MAKSVLIAQPVSRKVAVWLPAPSIEGYGLARQLLSLRSNFRCHSKKLIGQVVIFESPTYQTIVTELMRNLRLILEGIIHYMAVKTPPWLRW